MTKNKDRRVGFHSIESIIKNNPHKIKKLFLPSSRDDKRLNDLIRLSEENGLSLKYQES
jgi:23S rRNA (guanosine2251-2'-O)-methyltransferase